MKRTLIKNARIVNEGKQFQGSVLIEGDKIKSIFDSYSNINFSETIHNVINAEGLYLLPGVIDDQVHFREPGLTHKAEIYTEAKAAIAGGVTSYMEMPNTKPQTTNIDALNEKYETAAEKSLANYSFYFGATNDNHSELSKINKKEVCGIKVFMGSSTGNMLVDKPESLKRIFSETDILIATHCEDEETIQKNTKIYKERYGENLPIKYHPLIRSRKACLKSSSLAVELATRYNTRLHVLHISTEDELKLFTNTIPRTEKKITSEVCVHHLWFDDTKYDELGTRIKWNPAIKTAEDRRALMSALKAGTLDVVATDHAPHTLGEKQNSHFKAPSGGPLVQHSLVAMLELHHKNKLSLEMVVDKMSHAPADLYQIANRGYIREGYFADLVIVDLNDLWLVEENNILYKCGWSPFEGMTFKSKVRYTIVNGNIVYNDGLFDEKEKGRRLFFDR